MPYRYADLDILIADRLPELKTDEELAAVGRMIESASALVDKYCKRPAMYFLASKGDPEAKYFIGEGRNYLRLPVHVPGAATVEGVGDTTFYESDKNGWLYQVLGTEGWPVPESNYSDYSDDTGEYFVNCPFWIRGRRYKVTARWGYDEIPSDIVEAVTQMVVMFWNTQKGIFGQVTPTDFVIEQSIPPAARLTLDLYRRKEFEVGSGFVVPAPVGP